MRLRFTYRRGVEDEILRERGLKETVDESAQKIADAAKNYAPVATGRYRTSIVVQRDGDLAVVRSTAPYSAYVEWGTNDTPAAHPLARGLETVERSF